MYLEIHLCVLSQASEKYCTPVLAKIIVEIKLGSILSENEKNVVGEEPLTPTQSGDNSKIREGCSWPCSVLKISKDGDSRISLGNLLQC